MLGSLRMSSLRHMRPRSRSPQTRDIEPMLVQCWPAVYDVGLALNQHWFNVCWDYAGYVDSQAVGESAATGRNVLIIRSTFHMRGSRRCDSIMGTSPLWLSLIIPVDWRSPGAPNQSAGNLAPGSVCLFQDRLTVRGPGRSAVNTDRPQCEDNRL